MDAGGHSRAWEDNDLTVQPFTRRLPRSNEGKQVVDPPIPQTPTSSTFLQPNRRLPSLSSVFENNSIRSTSNLHPQSRDQANSYSPKTKPAAGPDQGIKRPRLSHDHSERAGIDVARDPAQSTISDLGPLGVRNETHPTKGNSQLAPERDPGCSICARTWPLIQRVLSGLQGLEAEIRRASARFALSSSSQQDSDNRLGAKYPGQDDLEGSLVWAARIVESGRFALAEVLAISGPLPSSALTSRSGSAQITANAASPVEQGYTENRKGYFVSSSSHGRVHSAGTSIVDQDRLGSFSAENVNASQPAQGGSFRETLPRHLQAPASQRRIVSQNSHNPLLQTEQPTRPQSPGSTFSAHAAHVQDLQHQVSTKTLALQSLQREHDSLLAAFSRQQTSYSTLDKKTKVADIEIKELTEEKLNLQSQVDNLEAQVEELFKSKEDAHQQSVASGAQYMKIMAMSSRLQAQSATDQKKWKAEKEEWEKEKETLVRKIQALETGDRKPQYEDQSQSKPSEPRPTELEPDTSTHTRRNLDDLLSPSQELLRSEVFSLRQKCREMETTLKELADETGNLDGMMQELTGLSQRLKQKVPPGNSLQQGLQSEEKMEDHQECQKAPPVE